MTAAGILDVLVIDDHRVFTDLLALAIDGQPDLRCVAVGNTVLDGLAKAAVYDIDVALVDLQLPDGGGLSVVQALRELRPAARIIVLTGYPRPDLMRQSFDRGADAFLSKDGALPEILSCIRGESRPARALARRAAAPIELTPREHEVLALMAGGFDARQIAKQLELSLHTVRDYIKTLLAKLDAHSQLDAVVTADRLGLVSIGERFR